MDKTPTIVTGPLSPPTYKQPSTPVNPPPVTLTVAGTRLKLRRSRVFTPIRNIIKTPEFSPIENIKNKNLISRPENVNSPEVSIMDSSFKNITMNSPFTGGTSDKTPVVNKSYLNHQINLDMFLMSHHFHKYMTFFDKAGIDFNDFISLNESDLARIGIENIQDRTAILRAIQEFQ